MIYVLCFGNPYLDNDNLAVKIGMRMKIRGYKFVVCSTPEQIVEYLNKDLVILDVAQGIKKPKVIDDISCLDLGKIVSLHDFDLAFFLNLIKKLGRRKNVKIIAIPSKATLKRVSNDLPKLLTRAYI